MAEGKGTAMSFLITDHDLTREMADAARAAMVKGHRLGMFREDEDGVWWARCRGCDRPVALIRVGDGWHASGAVATRRCAS